MYSNPVDLSRFAELFRYDPASPMLFNSGFFLFLFLGFLVVYSLIIKRPKMRIAWLVLFSLYFYYKSSGFYFLLLMAVSFSDFLIARAIHHSDHRRTRRWLVALSLAIDLGTLGYFKYTNFFIEIINNFRANPLAFENIFLPVGISFFMFQSISYVVDIYRKQVDPVRSWFDYLFYISFFPQLVAGPIVRARDFLPQVYRNPQVTSKMFGTGFFLIVTGLFKKAIISDYISLNFVDRIFDNPALYSGFENLMGVYGYALQIYCDFSGYSDMAIGIALLLGFRFNINFDSPYKSATITEFWRRWHISLSSWLRDYLYISLGGNRKGKLRTYFNLVVTMLIGGLWHGAAWRFVLWGGLHGVMLAGHKALMAFRPAVFKKDGASMGRWGRILGILITFHLVCFCWIFFRAESISDAWMLLGQIGRVFSPSVIPQFFAGYRLVTGLILIGYLLHFMPSRLEDWGKRMSVAAPMVVKVLVLAFMIWLVVQVKSSEVQPFIYFQF